MAASVISIFGKIIHQNFDKILTLLIPIPEDFYFHTSLWYLKRIYKNLKSHILIQLSEMHEGEKGKIYLWIEYFSSQ